MDKEILYHGILYNETVFEVEVLVVEVINGEGTVIEDFTIPAGESYEIDLPAGYYVIGAQCPLGVIIKEYDIPHSIKDPSKPWSITYRGGGTRI